MDAQASTLTDKLLSTASAIPLVADISRDHLANASISDIKTASTAKSAALPDALSAAEKSLGSLQLVDGGQNTANFKSDLNKINAAINPSSDRIDQHLPFLEITGVDAQGKIAVQDNADGKAETLTINDGLLTPSAPLDSSVNHQLYTSKEGPDGAIVPAAVEQGRLGDCYFMASVQSLAKENPQAIKNMIKDNGADQSGAHTYTVTFPGDASHPITVSEPNLYEASVFGQDQDGLWSAVLEKAHRGYTGKDTNDTGGDPADAMKLLTGNSATDIPSAKISASGSSNSLGTLISSALQDKDIVSMSTAPNASTIKDAGGNTIDLTPTHEYAVLGYDASTNMVTLDNPWDVNPVSGAFTPEPANPFVPEKYDSVLSKFDPTEEQGNFTGGTLTVNLADIAQQSRIVSIGQDQQPAA